METWLQTACRPGVIKRSAKVAVVVGTALVLINQGSVIFSGAANLDTFIRSALTYLVPFAVSTHGTVSALREQKPSDTNP